MQDVSATLTIPSLLPSMTRHYCGFIFFVFLCFGVLYFIFFKYTNIQKNEEIKNTKKLTGIISVACLFLGLQKIAAISLAL